MPKQKTNNFKLLVISFLALVFLLVSYFLYTKFFLQPLNINVVELQQTQQNESSETAIGVVEMPKTFDLKIKGEVIGTIAPQDYPRVIVSVEGQNIFKSVSLMQNGSYEITGITAKEGDTLKLQISSENYSFFPSSLQLVVEKQNITQNFEAAIKKSVKTNLNINGRLLAAFGGNYKGFIYCIGTSTSGEKIKLIEPIGNDGSFTFSNVPAGSYVLAPSIYGFKIFPNTKRVNIVNKDISVTFGGIKSF